MTGVYVLLNLLSGKYDPKGKSHGLEVNLDIGLSWLFGLILADLGISWLIMVDLGGSWLILHGLK